MKESKQARKKETKKEEKKKERMRKKKKKRNLKLLRLLSLRDQFMATADSLLSAVSIRFQMA